jgi:hypothetical protein
MALTAVLSLSPSINPFCSAKALKSAGVLPVFSLMVAK